MLHVATEWTCTGWNSNQTHRCLQECWWQTDRGSKAQSGCLGRKRSGDSRAAHSCRMSQQHGKALPKQHIQHTPRRSRAPYLGTGIPASQTRPWPRENMDTIQWEGWSSCRLFTEGRAKMQEDPKLSDPMAEMPSSSGAIQHWGVRAQESTAQAWLTGQAVNMPVFPIFPLTLISQIPHFITTHTTHITLIPAAHTLLLFLPLHVLLRHIYVFLLALPTPPRASLHTSLMAFLFSGIFSKLSSNWVFFLSVISTLHSSELGLSSGCFILFFSLEIRGIICGYKGGTLPHPHTKQICFQHLRYTSSLASLQHKCPLPNLIAKGITSEALVKVLSDIQDWGCLVPTTQRTGQPCARVFGLLLPDELPAVRAVGGLSQVGGHELVPVDLVHPPAHRPLPLPSQVLEDPVPLQGPCAGEGGEKRTMKH